MNLKAFIPIIAALFMGLIAAALARHVVGSRGPGGPRTPVVRVVVAKADLPPGHAIVAADLTVTPIAAAAPPANGYTDATTLVGRVTRVPMLAGQPVLEPLLAPQGVPDGLQALVPEGMRAITLETTESSGLMGLLSPGARVDVVTTATAANDAEHSVSRIIAQNVRVLAVGQHLAGTSQPADAGSPASRTVTLLVTPHDAATLDLAQTMARLRLILRGSGDNRPVDDDGVQLAELRGGAGNLQPAVMPVIAPAATQPAGQPSRQPAATQPADPAVPAEPSRRIVTLILGDKEQQLSFREQSKAAEPEVSDIKDPFANP